MNNEMYHSRAAVRHGAVGSEGGPMAVLSVIRQDTPRRHNQLQLTPTSTPLSAATSDSAVSRPPWSPSLGRLVRFTRSSLYFIALAEAPKCQRPLLQSAHGRRVMDERHWQDRVQQAQQRRKIHLADRRQALRRWHEHLRQRVLLQRHQDRLTQLHRKARTELSLRSAQLRRQIHMQQKVQFLSAQVEKAAHLSIVHRLRKCAERKRAHTEELSELIDGLSDIAEKVDDLKEDPKAIASSTAVGGEPQHLESLSAVFGTQLPTITYDTLRELNIDAILGNLQLRHDLLFDPNLEFRPNDDGERGIAKRARADAFWADIEADLDGTRHGGPVYARVPVLLNEIKKIMLDLVATDAYKQDLESNLDISLLAQELEFGVFNGQGTLKYLADTLKAHCAPARDCMVDAMLKAGIDGRFGLALRRCFEVLEQMKLDVANDQMRRLRPQVLESAVEHEWQHFKEQLQNGNVGLATTATWLTGASGPDASSRYLTACLDLVGIPVDQATVFPETFKLDTQRLVSLHNDWQDLVIQACLLTIFRQFAPRVAPTQMLQVKKNLWVLLNDGETTMAHIADYIANEANKSRPKALAVEERASLQNMLDKTLTPSHPVYSLLYKRSHALLLNFLKSGTMVDQGELSRMGLSEVGDELRDLARNLKSLIDHNKAVYAKVYDMIFAEENDESQ